MDARRKRLSSALIFLLIGVGGIAVAFARIGEHVAYPPGDLRGQPWFDPLVFWIQLALSVIALGTGLVLLIRLRGRTD